MSTNREVLIHTTCDMCKTRKHSDFLYPKPDAWRVITICGQDKDLCGDCFEKFITLFGELIELRACELCGNEDSKHNLWRAVFDDDYEEVFGNPSGDGTYWICRACLSARCVHELIDTPGPNSTAIHISGRIEE